MSLPSSVRAKTYQEDMAIIRTGTQWFLTIFAILFFYLVPPLVLDGHWLNVANRIGIAIIATLGLNLLTGYTGQISVGHSAFIAIGAYTSALLSVHAGLPFLIALPCSAITAGIIGVLFGLPSLRVKGFYLVMATLVAQVIIMYTLTHLSITGGQTGVPAPYIKIGDIVFDNQQNFYFITLTVLIICTFIAKNIARSKLGRAFVAIKDNDIAAEVMGISLTHYKVLAFFIGCMFAGIAGCLTAHWIGQVVPEKFTLMESLWYLGYLIVGGMGSIVGSFFGAIFVILLSESLNLILSALSSAFPYAASLLAPMQMILFGVIIAVFLIFEPRGLAHRWEIVKAYYRKWPFKY